MTRGFLRAGHLPTLMAAFFYFDISFMIWVVLGPLAPFIADDLQLSASQKGLLVATPLLAGSFFRPLLGALADVIGGRRAGLLGLTLTFVPLLLGWWSGSSFTLLQFSAVLLGIAGASFAVALPLASRWYPPQYQGLAMGIAGAGNSGTLLATLFAPRIAQQFGWQNAMGLAALPLLAVWIAFAFMAREAPTPRKRFSWSDYRDLLRDSDTAWFCGFYSITFGGFVGLASFLTVFFHDQYSMSKIQAGDFTTIVVLCGSFLRPVGGWLADRVGGYRVLVAVLLGASIALFGVSTLPTLPAALLLLAITMAMLGIGNGAIFQLVPQRFPSSVGIMTGLVGAAGGLGGFLLPSFFGVLKDATGSYGAGGAVFAGFALSGCACLILLGPRWLREWPERVTLSAGLFSWRAWTETDQAEA